MSSRQTGYLIGVILLAFVLTIPSVVIGTWLILEVYSGPILRIPLPFDGIHYVMREFGKRTAFPSQIPIEFWNDRYVDFDVYWRKGSRTYDHYIRWRDPVTGAHSEPEFALTSIDHLQPYVAGNRIWFVGEKETFEFVDGHWQKSSLDLMIPKRSWGSQPILWNGELVVVQRGPLNSFSVVHDREGIWQTIGNVVLPRSNPQETLTNALTPSRVENSLKCFNQGDQVHLFLKQDGSLFYREGLEIEPELPATNGAGELILEKTDVKPEAQLAGWSLVHPQTALPDDFEFVGLFVEGKLAIVIVEGIPSGTPVGRVYRFDGSDWSEFASQTFPLGSLSFQAESARDGMHSHLIVATSIGAMQTYLVDATGIRKTNGIKSDSSFFPIRVLVGCLTFAAAVVGSSIFLGMLEVHGISFLMRHYTKPDYEFGVHTVTLASLGWRCFARSIDLMIICVTTVVLAWLLTLHFDWLSLFESLNMGIDHPTILSAKRIVMLLAAWPTVLGVVMAITQAILGITPGKWLCCLRTLRSSLRPCGFAASLTREIVFFVDCCNFLCWTPGILSIALSDSRQRLGDRVADTIVIESRSVAPIIRLLAVLPIWPTAMHDAR